jgi:L-asparaginase II
VAIVPEKGWGIALKVVDGNGRASEAAIAGLLVRLGVLDAGHPATVKRMAGAAQLARDRDRLLPRWPPAFRLIPG